MRVRCICSKADIFDHVYGRYNTESRIGARNRHDAGVIPIDGEQSFTKRKKWVWESVVFQHDAEFFLFKKT